MTKRIAIRLVLPPGAGRDGAMEAVREQLAFLQPELDYDATIAQEYWQLGTAGGEASPASGPDLEALSLGARLSKDRIVALRRRLEGRDMGVQLEADPPIGVSDLWTPWAPGGGIFGTRRDALRLIGAPDRAPEKLGEGVNVVILDYGISDAWLRQYRLTHYGIDEGIKGGWARYQPLPHGEKVWFRPGDGPPPDVDHGHMLLRNILSIAPAANIWDLPLLPDTVLGPPGISMAEALFYHVRRDLRRGYQHLPDGQRKYLPDGPWILVNAWGALDPSRYDQHFFDRRRRYWDNPDHFFVKDMEKISHSGIDVVFAAGNCGQPGAHPLCGEFSSGAGFSIHGVNAHPDVLSVGAVRVDGVTIGTSAQGPGSMVKGWYANELHRCGNVRTVRFGDDPFNKPDLCAPSHFRETDDGTLYNTGTSAACGVAAGVLAAMRSVERANSGKRLPPSQLRHILRATAQQPGSQNWDPQMGWGIINLKAAMAAMKAVLPAEASS